MTLPRSAAEVLADHVTLKTECIDRMYLNLYVPRLQYTGGVVGFFREHRGATFASSALMDPITKAFVADIHRFAKTHGVEVVDFVKGQRKDDVALERLARFDREEGVVFIGRAQEKCSVFRTEKRRNPVTGKAYPWIVRGTAIVNHFYFYLLDCDFGPLFIKFATYFPYNAKMCLNGNEYAKRQLAKAAIAFEPLDNGVAACAEPQVLQDICDHLDAAAIDALIRKWLKLLPHPFTPADRAAGYRYDVSVLQAEFSLTQILDRPLAGRVLFEDLIRDHLDLGRPDQVALIFDRRVRLRGKNPTPSRFRTRVITHGVIPSLHVDYKHSRIKQYHKLGRALRTETTINDTRDFGIGKRLHNLDALRQVGFNANRRLLDVQQTSCDTATAAAAYAAVTAPATVEGQRAAALRFDDPRVHALLSALVVFRLLPQGFANRDLRPMLAQLLGLDPETMTPGRMTYDLRRLRLHGLIARIPGSHRYRVTEHGMCVALLFTRIHNRVLRPGLAQLGDPHAVASLPLRRALDRLNAAIDTLAVDAKVAA